MPILIDHSHAGEMSLDVVDIVLAWWKRLPSRVEQSSPVS